MSENEAYIKLPYKFN